MNYNRQVLNSSYDSNYYNMNRVLKLPAIIVSVFLMGYFLEVAIDDFGISPLVENTIELI